MFYTGTLQRVHAQSLSFLFLIFALFSVPLQAEIIPGKYVTGIAFVSGPEQSSDPCPGTYGPGWRWDLNSTNPLGSNHMYMCKHYQDTGTARPITDVQIMIRDSASNAPCNSGYAAAGYRTPGGNAGIGIADLNRGVGGKYVYLCSTNTGRINDIFDLDIVFLGNLGGFLPGVGELVECPTGYRSVSGNLNAGRGFPTETFDQSICKADAFSLGWLHPCGGEGEARCPATSNFTFLNASNCDDGLKENPNSGICENDTRRSGASDEFASSWHHWALLHQVNQISRYAPPQEVTLIGAHNAYNAKSDGFLFPNQQHSITEQLNAGIRLIDLDIYNNDITTLPRLCHGFCSPFDRLFEGGLKEIAAWMRTNPDQTLLILLEDYVFESFEKKLQVEYLIRYYLDHPDIGVVKTSQIENKQQILNDDGNLVYINGLPSRQQMLDADTRILILSQSSTYGDLVHKKHSRFTHRLGGLEIQAFSMAPLCKETSAAQGLAEYWRARTRRMFEVLGDQLPGGADFLTQNEVAGLTRCGVNLINMDNILATGVRRLEAGVWSWEEGDRGQYGTAATLIGATGRWRSREHDARLPFACKVGFDFRVTTAEGAFDQGWSICRGEFGPRAEYIVPVNAFFNGLLKNASRGENVWMNYHDLNQDGVFDQLPAPDVINPLIRLTGQPKVDESPNPVTYAYQYTGNQGVFLVPIIPSCGEGGWLVPNSLVTTATSGTFDCVFPSYAAETSKVSLTVSDVLGSETFDAELDVQISNVVPRVDEVAWEPSVIDEGDTARLRVSFSDPGDSEHFVRFNGPDGRLVLHPVPRGERTAEIPLRYVDGGRGATSTTLRTVQVSVTDGELFSNRPRAELTVRNVAPIITNVTLTDVAGTDLGSSPVVGELVNILVQFSDPGILDEHTVELDPGDGSTPQSFSYKADATQAQFTHTYVNAGEATMRITVTDKDGGQAVWTADLNSSTTLSSALSGVLESIDALQRPNRYTNRARFFVKRVIAIDKYAGDSRWVRRVQRYLIKHAVWSLQRAKRRHNSDELKGIILELRYILRSLGRR